VRDDDVLFFFQAEDGIRDYKVTGVQTCALPISGSKVTSMEASALSSASTATYWIWGAACSAAWVACNWLFSTASWRSPLWRRSWCDHSPTATADRKSVV